MFQRLYGTAEKILLQTLVLLYSNELVYVGERKEREIEMSGVPLSRKWRLLYNFRIPNF